MNRINVLLIGGPKDGEMIETEPVLNLRFVSTPELAVRFRGVETQTMTELKMDTHQYEVYSIRGEGLLRYVGIHQDLNWDIILERILGWDI